MIITEYSVWKVFAAGSRKKPMKRRKCCKVFLNTENWYYIEDYVFQKEWRRKKQKEKDNRMLKVQRDGNRMERSRQC